METLSMSLVSGVMPQEAKQEPGLSARLDTLFMGVKHQINFFPDGNTCMVADVTYTDFLPLDVVKGIIRKMLPKSFHLSIHREYSPKVISAFLYQEFCENNVGIIDCINGSLEARSIRQFVNDRLDENVFCSEVTPDGADSSEKLESN